MEHFDELRCAVCDVPWVDHANPPHLRFVLDNTTAEEVRQHIAALTVLVDQLRAAYAEAQERIQALDPLPLPLYSNRQKVERLAPAAGPGGAPVSFGWKVGWAADELVRVRAELEGLRTYLARSIAADIGGDTEAWEILAGLPDEDTAMIARWIEEMREPAYWSKDIAKLTAELEGLRAKQAELAGRYPKPHLRLLSSDIASPPACAWAPETWRMAIIGNAATWVDLETTADVVGYAAPGGDEADWTALLMMLRAGTPGRASKRLAWHVELGIYCFRNYREGLATPFQFRREEAPAVAAWLEEKLAELHVKVVVPVLDELDEAP